MAVAIWDQSPEPDQLLNWHMAKGWTATASDLVEGKKILGYAACRLAV